MKDQRDLRRFAVCDEATGEVLEAGLTEIQAESYVASFNKAMFRAGRRAKRVPMEWSLADSHERAACLN